MKYLKNKKGFTLIELIIASTLILVVMGLAYSVYSVSQKALSESEARLEKQGNVNTVADFLYDNLSGAMFLNIINTNAPVLNAYERYIYIDSSVLKHKSKEGEDSTEIETDILDCNITLRFEKGEDDFGNDMSKVLKFTVTDNDIDYSVASHINLANMPEGTQIEWGSPITVEGSGEEEVKYGNAVCYKSVSTMLSLPTTEISTFCFIATAAYGTYDEPAVRLLREFRDEVLLKTETGEKLVDFYYRNSPPIADFIAKSKPLRLITRIFLYPFVSIAYMRLNTDFMLLVLLYVVLLSIMIRKNHKAAL